MPSTDPRLPRPGRRRQREIRELQRTSTLSWTEAADQVDLEHAAKARGIDIARARLTIVEPQITGDNLASWRESQSPVLITVEDPRQPDPIEVQLQGSTPAREELGNLGWLEVCATLAEHGWEPIEARHVDVFAVARNHRGTAGDEWTRIITSAGLPVDGRAAHGYLLAVLDALNEHGIRTRVRGMPIDNHPAGTRVASVWLDLPPEAAHETGESTVMLAWHEHRGWSLGLLGELPVEVPRLAPPQRVVAAIAQITGIRVPVDDGTGWTPPPGYDADAAPQHRTPGLEWAPNPAQAAAFATYAASYLNRETAERDE